jgi:hypothetical protein
MDSDMGMSMTHLRALEFSCGSEAMGETAQMQAEEVVLKIIQQLRPAMCGVFFALVPDTHNAVNTVNENQIYDFNRWAEESRVSQNFMKK